MTLSRQNSISSAEGLVSAIVSVIMFNARVNFDLTTALSLFLVSKTPFCSVVSLDSKSAIMASSVAPVAILLGDPVRKTARPNFSILIVMKRSSAD